MEQQNAKKKKKKNFFNPTMRKFTIFTFLIILCSNNMVSCTHINEEVGGAFSFWSL